MKSNSISFWRIVFTIAIVLLHIGYGRGSYIAVEFFFIVSGFLLAKKVYGSKKDTSIPAYIWNRFTRLYPIYIIALIIYIMVLEYQGSPAGFILNGIKDLPGFWKQILMLTPFGNPPAFFVNIPAWYVCVLFYGSIVFYILLNLIPKKVILPIISGISIMILGYYFVKVGNLDLFETYRSIYIGSTEIVLGSDGVFRGISEIGLGILLNVIFDETKDKFHQNRMFIVYTLEFALLIGMVTISVFINHTRLDFVYLIVILICVYFAFLPHKAGFFSNIIVEYLGGLSYSIYLNHAVFAWIIFAEYAFNWDFKRIMIYLFCVGVVSIIVDLPIRIIGILTERKKIKKDEKIL